MLVVMLINERMIALLWSYKSNSHETWHCPQNPARWHKNKEEIWKLSLLFP